MRGLCLALCGLTLSAAFLPGQEERRRDRRDRPGSRRLPVSALEVGTIHPVSGPSIQNGVILIRGRQILAVGKKAEVEVPEGAQVLSYPEAHAYPGLVDALSSAYADSADLSAGGTKADSDFADALDRENEASQKLVQSGITTAYVCSRANAAWRGLGVLIRPRQQGFGSFRRKKHGGMQLRMTSGRSASHPLARQKALQGVGKPFDALEDYEKKAKEHEKALAEYKKKYKEYLDYYLKKKAEKAKKKPDPKKEKTEKGKEETKKDEKDKEKDKEKPKDPTPKKEGEKPAPRPEGRRSRRRPTGGTEGGRRRIGGRRPGAAATSTAKGGKDGKAPEKPKYPKAPKKDPAKEALLRVLNGELPLRIEVHRKEEILAALKLGESKEIPLLTLEGACEASEIAEELALAGVPVVITELLPVGTVAAKPSAPISLPPGLGRGRSFTIPRSRPSGGSRPAPYEKNRDGSLPGKLHAYGVPVAIASGRSEAAHHLTLMAAYACGRGLPEAAAVRAITLTAAEILGVEEYVGSLSKGKLADVLITTGPLLKSDTRVLRVLSQGRTEYEAK